MFVERRDASKNQPASADAATGLGRTRRGLFTPNPMLKLREQVHEVTRFFHYSPRTEEVYWHWMRRFLVIHRGKGDEVSREKAKRTKRDGETSNVQRSYVFSGQRTPLACRKPRSTLFILPREEV